CCVTLKSFYTGVESVETGRQYHNWQEYSSVPAVFKRSEKNSKISKFLKGAADRDVGNTDFSMLMACCTSTESEWD
ncbi:hypothetical protein QQF64_019752, partial [Cirrhinus molitorella]